MFNFPQREVTVAKGRFWEVLTKEEINQLDKGLYAQIPRLPGTKLSLDKFKNVQLRGSFEGERIEAKCDLAVEFEAGTDGILMGYKITNVRGASGVLILAEGASGRLGIEGESPFARSNGGTKDKGDKTPKRSYHRKSMKAETQSPAAS